MCQILELLIVYMCLLIYLQEKQNYIPDELGRDAQSVAAFQRKHANFESDLITLESQVRAILT